MAPKYTLHYFNVTALGEPLRFLLAYGKEEWEDKRYTPEEWAKAKPTMPLEKMPVLEFNGKKYPQSVALSRFLATKYGLVGKDDMENLQIDIAVHTFTDLRLAIGGWFYDAIEESKTSKFEPLMKTTIPFYLSKFEGMVKENGGFLANGKLSWADIYVVASLKYFNALVEFDLFEKYSALKELRSKVEAVPQIAAYIAQRPPGDK